MSIIMALDLELSVVRKYQGASGVLATVAHTHSFTSIYYRIQSSPNRRPLGQVQLHNACTKAPRPYDHTAPKAAASTCRCPCQCTLSPGAYPPLLVSKSSHSCLFLFFGCFFCFFVFCSVLCFLFCVSV